MIGTAVVAGPVTSVAVLVATVLCVAVFGTAVVVGAAGVGVSHELVHVTAVRATGAFVAECSSPGELELTSL